MSDEDRTNRDNEAELLLAGEAFCRSLFGKANYGRWKDLKKKNDFQSENEFVSWLLDIVEMHMEQEFDIPSTNTATETVEGAELSHPHPVQGSLNATGHYKHEKICREPKLTQKVYYSTEHNMKPPRHLVQNNLDSFNINNNLEIIGPSQVSSVPMTSASSSIVTMKDLNEIAVDLDDDGELDIDDSVDVMSSVAEVSTSSSSQNLQCRVCDEVAQSGLGLLDHMNERHSDLSLEEREAMSCGVLVECEVSCVFCNKLFASKASMLQHIKATHLSWKCKCDECDKEFTSVRNLSRHKVTVHLGIRNFPCAYCGLAFKRSHHLARHLQKHTSLAATTPILSNTAATGFKW